MTSTTHSYAAVGRTMLQKVGTLRHTAMMQAAEHGHVTAARHGCGREGLTGVLGLLGVFVHDGDGELREVAPPGQQLVVVGDAEEQ